jgi:phosphatidylserine decarboxylase
MVWVSALAGIGVAGVMLLPLAIKWELPLRIVAVWIVVVGAVWGAVWALVLGDGPQSWGWLLADVASVLVASIVVVAIAFYRDPERVAPQIPGAVVSPADGTIVYVRRFAGGEVPPIEKKGRALDLRELSRVDVGDTGYLVGIAMNLLNVHVNRAPIAGCAVSLVHVPGRFVSLKREDATTLNERFTTVIEGDSMRVVVVQIASRLVRRIVTFLQVDQTVSAGQRIGVIKFGSQVDVILPGSDDLEIAVRPGDTVRAGVSVLALVGKGQSAGE